MAQNRKKVIYLPLVCCALLTLGAFLVLTQSYAHAADSKWTLLLYYAGDNDLENDIEKTLSALEHVERDKVKIVVLVDDLFSDGLQLHEINGSENNITILPEANTADPATIEWFVKEYGMSQYPYEKTMLIIKGYGFSWRGVCLDEASDSQIMPFDGLAGVLTGKGIDLLMFDAERMSMLEIAYNLRDTARYMIATQSLIPNDGIPYDLFLAKLIQDPTMSVEEFASEIMSSYITLYDNDFSTLTLCDLSAISGVGQAFCKLTDVFANIIGSYRFCVSPARDASDIGLHNAIDDTEYLHDLYTFFDFLVTEKVIPEEEFQEAVEELKEAISVAVVEEVHSHRYRAVPHGLSFWFPPSETRYTADDVTFNGEFIYEDCGLDILSENCGLDVVFESSWVDCMMTYYSAPRGGAAHGYQKEKKPKQ
jgi:hypothetical protein